MAREGFRVFTKPWIALAAFFCVLAQDFAWVSASQHLVLQESLEAHLMATEPPSEFRQLLLLLYEKRPQPRIRSNLDEARLLGLATSGIPLHIPQRLP